eukprot:GDKI01027582.1.p1 GENE.GDKI01027582.1~~GDKI01027582.1.p1  ORF type:complete len:115 (-),score=24.12 GDKI01027582.1:47-391(-)
MQPMGGSQVFTPCKHVPGRSCACCTAVFGPKMELTHNQTYTRMCTCVHVCMCTCVHASVCVHVCVCVPIAASFCARRCVCKSLSPSLLRVHGFGVHGMQPNQRCMGLCPLSIKS